MEVDLVNRDPNNLNTHVRCQFEDVLGEPDGAHSIDCVWKLAFTCYNFWRGCCYKLSGLFCGLCIAAYWGCEFAGLAFGYVWCCTPCMRFFSIQCATCQQFFGTIMQCCLAPICEACGSLFSAIKIKNEKL